MINTLLQMIGLFFLPFDSYAVLSIFINGGLILVVIVCLGIFLITAWIFRFLVPKRKKRKKEFIPPVTGLLGDSTERLEELNKELEPYGFAYEPGQDIFYSNMYCWQRKYGYCWLYDEASAPLSMIIDCEPIHFNFNGKKWLIEFWKGQYGMTSGGEVGIYYTNGPEINIPGLFNGTFYYCVSDEDRINMSFALRKNGNLLFTRNAYHWWITGFKLGEFSQPSELTMDIILTLTNKQMCNAFVEALKKKGYQSNDFTARGRTVWIHYTKPHSIQPLSRTSLMTYFVQRNNEAFCKSYQYLTQEYTDTMDKLEIVRNESPNMYRHILQMGKSKQVFDSFHTIQAFLNTKKDS